MELLYGAIGLFSGVVLGGAFVGGSLVLMSLLLFLPGMLAGHPLPFLDVSAMVGLQTALAAGTAALAYRDVVQLEILGPLLVPAVFLSVAGALLSPVLPLGVILALLGSVVAFTVYRLWRAGPSSASGARPRPWQLWVTGAAAGFLSGLYGIGGGFLMVPLLMLSGLPARAAVGNALATGAAIAVVGLLVKAPHLPLSHFPIEPLVLVVIGSSLGAQLGGRAARRVPDIWMRRVVMALLLLVMVRIGLSPWLA
jgi:uncharacterized membrane protein YfcA